MTNNKKSKFGLSMNDENKNDKKEIVRLQCYVHAARKYDYLQHFVEDYDVRMSLHLRSVIDKYEFTNKAIDNEADKLEKKYGSLHEYMYSWRNEDHDIVSLFNQCDHGFIQELYTFVEVLVSEAMTLDLIINGDYDKVISQMDPANSFKIQKFYDKFDIDQDLQDIFNYVKFYRNFIVHNNCRVITISRLDNEGCRYRKSLIDLCKVCSNYKSLFSLKAENPIYYNRSTEYQNHLRYKLYYGIGESMFDKSYRYTPRTTFERLQYFYRIKTWKLLRSIPIVNSSKDKSSLLDFAFENMEEALLWTDIGLADIYFITYHEIQKKNFEIVCSIDEKKAYMFNLKRFSDALKYTYHLKAEYYYLYAEPKVMHNAKHLAKTLLEKVKAKLSSSLHIYQTHNNFKQ